ncbi:MAG: dTMP kinase [Spirochaetia bacterium]|nr:dTMP kinase [Spirochaetia bacterium]
MNQVLANFIVIEGLDGSGTTTQLKKIVELFDKNSISTHATFEPTSSPLGTLVRQVLRKEVVTTGLALALLFAADREDHLYHPITGITHRLENNEVVISDRYFFSSLAYQSIDCGYEKVLALNDFPYPEFIFFIDTPVEDCLFRIDERKEEKELFEHSEFLTLVKQNYDKIFSELPPDVKFFRLDGRKSRESLTQEMADILTKHNIL